MNGEQNPYEASEHGSSKVARTSHFAVLLSVYLVVVLVGLVVGSYISVHIANAWYPDEADGDVLGRTIASVLASPIAMTVGFFPTLGFYGPLHAIQMLLGMVLTAVGTWMHFRSRRLVHVWVVFLGMVLWSHNNYLAFNALMSV